MESTSLVFAAVESQLSERQVCSQFPHCICFEEQRLVLTISRYDDSNEYHSKDGLPTTTLETRSQPPGKKK